MSLMFLPQFDVFCDLLLNRCTATWNLFVLYNKEITEEIFILKSCNITQKPAFPTLAKTKKSI